MQIVGMLRVKDEARWIDRVIRAMHECCDRILVLDDNSTDGTAEICCGLGVTLFRSRLEGLNETRDKNVLLAQVELLNPDWVLHLDGDEEISNGGAERIRQLTALPFDSYRFHFLYLWDKPDQIRTDGVYRHYVRGSMFRFRPGMRFADTAHGGNFHCGNVPESGKQAEADVKILHYGYLNREDRMRKYSFYTETDVGNAQEDYYRHMVVGDLFPADSVFLYGGPLRLEPLSAELIPQGFECQSVA